MSEARELSEKIAVAIRGGEPAQREFDGKCSDEDTLCRAVELAWRGQYDYVEEELCRGITGWDVWGFTSETPDNEQEWRLFVHRT